MTFFFFFGKIDENIFWGDNVDVVRIVGYSDYSFVDDRGKPVTGRKYHAIAPKIAAGFVGMESLSFSASLQLQASWANSPEAISPDVGDTVIVVYNRYGKLEHFEKCDAELELK